MFGVPLEYLMFGGIGFCLAWLMALMVLPAVHNRATRLARERYEAVPLSMQEIRAEKDTIRAGFAAATRELELRIEALRDKTVAHATDLARKTQLIDRLKQELDATTASLRDSETREQDARAALREAKAGFASRDVTLGSAEEEIAALKSRLAASDAALHAAAQERAAKRDELAAKDAALNRAEHEVAAIRAEIAALTKLLVDTGSETRAQPPRPAATPRLVEIVPFIPASRSTVQPASADDTLTTPEEPRHVRQAPPEIAPSATARPVQQDESDADDSVHRAAGEVHRAASEITDAAKRIDEQHEGQNQRLRAIYAPFIKGTT